MEILLPIVQFVLCLLWLFLSIWYRHKINILGGVIETEKKIVDVYYESGKLLKKWFDAYKNKDFEYAEAFEEEIEKKHKQLIEMCESTTLRR